MKNDSSLPVINSFLSKQELIVDVIKELGGRATYQQIFYYMKENDCKKLLGYEIYKLRNDLAYLRRRGVVLLFEAMYALPEIPKKSKETKAFLEFTDTTGATLHLFIPTLKRNLKHVLTQGDMTVITTKDNAYTIIEPLDQVMTMLAIIKA